jgi:hypothetical protein
LRPEIDSATKAEVRGWTKRTHLTAPTRGEEEQADVYRHLPTGHIGDREEAMNSIVWLVGAVVIVLFVLGFLGLR